MDANSYSTTDFYLAAYLMSVGLPLQRMTTENDRKRRFWFARVGGILALVEEFHRDERMQAFKHGIRDLKSRLHGD